MTLDPAAPPGVLFLPVHGPSWNEMHWLARSLAAQGLARPLMLIPPSCARLPRPQGDDGQLEYRRLAGLGTTQDAGLVRLLRRLILGLGGPRAGLPWDRARQRAQLSEHLRQLKAVVQGFNPVMAVLAGDRQLGWELPMVGLCRRLSLKIILPPISYVGDQSDLTAIRRSERFDAERDPELRRRFPGQYIRDHLTGRRVWFYEPAAMLAANDLGLLPPNPWAMGSGAADLILVDGDDTRDRLVSAGTDIAKIVVSGHRSHDDLFAGLQRRAELRRELAPLAEPTAAKWLVVSLPPLGEANLCGWDRHWQEMRFLAQLLSKATAVGAGTVVLVSLHPKMDSGHYAFLHEEYGLEVSSRPLASILPAADMFMASQGSTTIQWAVLCGLPAIALDVYGLNQMVNPNMDGVRVISKREEILSEITRLTSKEGYYQALAAEQRKVRGGLSPFDGRCGQRTIAELARLLVDLPPAP